MEKRREAHKAGRCREPALETGKGPADKKHREKKKGAPAGLAGILPYLEGKRVILTVPFGEGKGDGEGK